MQRALRDEAEHYKSEVNSLQKQIAQLTADFKEGNILRDELETEVNALNEELRNAKRLESSLNELIQELRVKVSDRESTSEQLKKLQAENGEFKSQISELQERLDVLTSQRNQLSRQVASLQAEIDQAKVAMEHRRELEKQFGSPGRERDNTGMS